MKNLMLAMLVGLMLTSCPSMQTKMSVPAVYVTADRATFEALAPIIQDLSDADPTNDPDLSGINGEALLLLIETWETRLTSAEKAYLIGGSDEPR